MRFPLDNDSRKTPGVKIASVHDATGRIIFQVTRVNLPMAPGEPVGLWRSREQAATVARTTLLVRLLNAAYAVVRHAENKGEQAFLPGYEFLEELQPDEAKPRETVPAASTESMA